MSKAEEFIRVNTRNCGNVCSYNSMECEIPWLTPDDARKVAEIARQETIKEVCEFLDNSLCCYIKAQDFAIEHQRLENDLKQAMNDETQNL